MPISNLKRRLNVKKAPTETGQEISYVTSLLTQA